MRDKSHSGLRDISSCPTGQVQYLRFNILGCRGRVYNDRMHLQFCLHWLELWMPLRLEVFLMTYQQIYSIILLNRSAVANLSLTKLCKVLLLIFSRLSNLVITLSMTLLPLSSYLIHIRSFCNLLVLTRQYRIYSNINGTSDGSRTLYMKVIIFFGAL